MKTEFSESIIVSYASCVVGLVKQAAAAEMLMQNIKKSQTMALTGVRRSSKATMI